MNKEHPGKEKGGSHLLPQDVAALLPAQGLTTLKAAGAEGWAGMLDASCQGGPQLL